MYESGRFKVVCCDCNGLARLEAGDGYASETIFAYCDECRTMQKVEYDMQPEEKTIQRP